MIALVWLKILERLFKRVSLVIILTLIMIWDRYQFLSPFYKGLFQEHGGPPTFSPPRYGIKVYVGTQGATLMWGSHEEYECGL